MLIGRRSDLPQCSPAVRDEELTEVLCSITATVSVFLMLPENGDDFLIQIDDVRAMERWRSRVSREERDWLYCHEFRPQLLS
jgi:hypothetical protein